MKPKNEELISLREAAKISGYTPDYIGQLIRGGKLQGRQVFSSVAWMTTEGAVLDYLEKNAKNQPVTGVSKPMLSAKSLEKIYLGVMWMVIGVCGLFVLLLVFIFAVSLDHRVERYSLEQSQYAR